MFILKECFLYEATLSYRDFINPISGGLFLTFQRRGWGLFGPRQKNHYKTCSFHQKPMKLDTISNENNLITCFKNDVVIKNFDDFSSHQSEIKKF